MSFHIPLSSGQTIYKYQLKHKIGGGENGEVWLTFDNTIDREIAVKILDANVVSLNEKLLEAKIGNHVEHPNLIKVHYADVISTTLNQLLLIAMDFIEKGSVDKQVNAGNFIPLPKVISIIIDILRGLEYLHEQGLYHNDIKPQNILIGDKSEGILSDYGITCKSVNYSPVQHRGFYKPHVAPETLINNLIDYQTDIYQVGITLFRLLNGLGTIKDKYLKYGEIDFFSIVQKGKVITSEDYQSFIPSNLKRIINKATNVKPENRFKSALEFRRALEKLKFAGFWSCDSNGKLIGENEKSYFCFEEKTKGANLYEFIALKTNKASGKQICIHEFSKKNLSLKELKSLRESYFQNVIVGKIH